MVALAQNECQVTELTTGLLFPYGVLWYQDGAVLTSEQARGAITRVTVEGETEVVAHCGGTPAGFAIGPDGWAYVCNGGTSTWHEVNGMMVRGDAASNYNGGSIQRVNVQTGEVQRLYSSVDGHRLSSPCDIVFDSSGGFWFTDKGKARGRVRDRGGLYYAEPDGSEIREVVYPLDAPAGIGLSPSEDVLYVAESTQGRLYEWPLWRPGDIAGYFGPQHRGQIVADPKGGPLFNALSVDDGGRVYVATSRNGGVTTVAADGSTYHTSIEDPLVTGVAFGGPDFSTLLLTSSGNGRLMATTWHSAGLKPSF